MLLFKLKYKISSFFKKILMKIVYKDKINFGKRFNFRKSFEVMIGKSGKLDIGNDCFFNNNCSIFCLQKIEIGHGTIFGENVKIYDHNHKFKNNKVLIKHQGYSTDEIVIGSNCWFGSNTVILKGVKIGDNCVIGANCVIDFDIPQNTIIQSERNYIKTIIVNK